MQTERNCNSNILDDFNLPECTLPFTLPYGFSSLFLFFYCCVSMCFFVAFNVRRVNDKNRSKTRDKWNANKCLHSINLTFSHYSLCVKCFARWKLFFFRIQIDHPLRKEPKLMQTLHLHVTYIYLFELTVLKAEWWLFIDRTRAFKQPQHPNILRLWIANELGLVKCKCTHGT